MIRGYARVSTQDQNVDLQVQALREAGCEALYVDHGVSGTCTTRPELDRLLSELDDGDVLIVWKLDRLGRSLQHLLEVVTGFGERGIDFKSLTEAMDTTTPSGRLVFRLMASLSEFERDIIVERTKAGLSAAKVRGVSLGRPKSMSYEQVAHARELVDAGEPKRKVARLFKVSAATLYRALLAA